MSLSDLKKSKKNNGNKKDFTVDEFINDAENYANGKPQIVGNKQQNSVAVAEAVTLAKKQKAKKKLFRHATFTFNEQTFIELNELAKSTKLAKSHILRILIAQLSEQDKDAQLNILLRSKVD